MTAPLCGVMFQHMTPNTIPNEENIQPLEASPNQAPEEQNRASKELSILYNISNAMRTTLELNHILYIILTGVTSHAGLGFNRAVLFLLNKKERALEAQMAIGPDSGEHADKIWKYIKAVNPALEDLIATDKLSAEAMRSSKMYQSLQGFKIPLNPNDRTLLSTVYYNGGPLHVEREMISQYAHDPLLKVFPTKELVIMPLKAKDHVNGLIIADNLYTQKPITDEDLKIFTMLANQAGLAIENSRLYEMVVHKSHTDSLTGLWNHGFFQHTLNLEIQKAKENKYPLSLLIMDIDNFKKLNDAYGHQNGDVVLTELAYILKESARENDSICRYGGEEFSVILPQMSKDQASVVAERMREKIAHHDFSKFPDFSNLSVTVSLGLASFPEDAENKEDLIAKADKAMYIAKFGGKNRTYVCGPEEA